MSFELHKRHATKDCLRHRSRLEERLPHVTWALVPLGALGATTCDYLWLPDRNYEDSLNVSYRWIHFSSLPLKWSC